MRLNRFALLTFIMVALTALSPDVLASTTADSLRAVLSVPAIEFKTVPDFNRVQTDSLTALAKEYNDWLNPEADHALANQLFLQAAENGSMEALRQLAQNTINGLGTEANPELGLRMLMQGVNAGDVKSMLALGKCLNPKGTNIISQLDPFINLELAEWAFMTAGQQGESKGYLEAASMFSSLNNLAFREDEKTLGEIKCIAYAELGQAMGNGRCSEILASLYNRNETKSREEINDLWIDAAEKGDPAAMLRISEWYDKGEHGFKKDKDLARYWFIKWQSQAKPSPWRMYFALSEGRHGIKKDKRAAVDWLIAGVEGNDPLYVLYCRELAEIYSEGSHGVTRDMVKAQYYENLAKNPPVPPIKLLDGIDFCDQRHYKR